MTLLELVTNGLSYDSNFGVYIEGSGDGGIDVNCPARVGQMVFDGGGVLDECTFLAPNTRIIDFLENYDDVEEGLIRFIESEFEQY